MEVIFFLIKYICVFTVYLCPFWDFLVQAESWLSTSRSGSKGFGSAAIKKNWECEASLLKNSVSPSVNCIMLQLVTWEANNSSYFSWLLYFFKFKFCVFFMLYTFAIYVGIYCKLFVLICCMQPISYYMAQADCTTCILNESMRAFF